MKRIILIAAPAAILLALIIYLAAPRSALRDTVVTADRPDIGSRLMREVKLPARDPFSSPSGTVAAVVAVVPQLKLGGIMYSESAPEAIVNMPDGSSRTVRAGETLAGETILQITRDYVIIKKQGRKFKLTSRSWEPIE